MLMSVYKRPELQVVRYLKAAPQQQYAERGKTGPAPSLPRSGPKNQDTTLISQKFADKNSRTAEYQDLELQLLTLLRL